MKKLLFCISLALFASNLMVLAQDAPTREERKQMNQARLKALELPAMAELKQKAQAAEKAAWEESKSKLLAKDPSLAPILEKVQGFSDIRALPPEELAKVRAATKGITVNLKKDQTPAAKELEDALRPEMIKIDPAVGPILDKLNASQK